MRFSVVLLFAVLVLTSEPVYAAPSGRSVQKGLTSQNWASITSIETNVHLGIPKKESDENFPQGRNNYKASDDENASIVPTLKKHICIGADCGCGTGE